MTLKSMASCLKSKTLIRTSLSLALIFSLSSQAAIVSRILTFSDGSVLTASQLNSEFNNLVNGVNALDNTNLISSANISPSKINATIAGTGMSRDVSTGTITIADGGVTKVKLATDIYLPPTGAMMDYGGSAAPTGWFLCDGSAVSRTTYADLFAVIGTTYGVGDNVTTFNVPDFRGRVAMGAGQGSGLSNRVLGAQPGEENHTMTTGEMVAHTHTITDPGHGHLLSGNHVTNPPGIGDRPIFANVADTGSTAAIFTSTTGITINSTGSTTPFNVIQPSLVANKIIKY